MTRVALIALLLAMASSARAQEVVALASTECDDVVAPIATLAPILALELVDAGARLAPDALAPVDARVSLACADATLQLVIDRDGTTHTREIAIEGNDADGRARIVALAIAELVLATRPRAEIAPPPEPVVEEAPAIETEPVVIAPVHDDAPPPIAPPPEEGWTVQLLVALGGAWVPLDATGLGTLRAGLRVTAPSSMPWALELAVRGVVGAGRATRWAGTHAEALVGELAALALARVDSVRIGGGVELDAGPAWAAGALAATDVRTYVDPVVIASARATMLAQVSPDVGLTVDVRAGWAICGVELRSSDVALVGLSGLVVSLDVGTSFDLR